MGPEVSTEIASHVRAGYCSSGCAGFTKATELTFASPAMASDRRRAGRRSPRVPLATFTHVTEEEESTIQVLARPVVSRRGPARPAFNRSRGEKQELSARGRVRRSRETGATRSYRGAREPPRSRQRRRAFLAVLDPPCAHGRHTRTSQGARSRCSKEQNGLRHKRSQRAAAVVGARRIDRAFLLSVKELATIPPGCVHGGVPTCVKAPTRQRSRL